MERIKPFIKIIKIVLLSEVIFTILWVAFDDFFTNTWQSLWGSLWFVLFHLNVLLGAFALVLMVTSWILHLPLRRYGIHLDSIASSLCWLLLAGLFIFVVPRFLVVFREMNYPLPFKTQWLLLPRLVWSTPCLIIAYITLVKDRKSMPAWFAAGRFILPVLIFILIIKGLMLPTFNLVTVVRP
jgi:hypothetical protein